MTPSWKAGGISRVSTRFSLSVENDDKLNREGYEINVFLLIKHSTGTYVPGRVQERAHAR